MKNKKEKERANKSKKGNVSDDAKKKNSSSGKSLFWIATIIVFIVAIFFLIQSNKLKSEPFENQTLSPIYNGFYFNQTAQFGLWAVVVKTPLGDIPMEFHYHPEQVDMYSYNVNITRDMANMMLRKGNFFIAFDTNYSDKGIAAVAGSEISKITGKLFSLETRSGFIDYAGDNIPIINCSVANYKNMVLEFRAGEENKIVYDNNYCIRIYSKTPEDMVKLADFLDYNLLGIISSRNKSGLGAPVIVDVPNITISR